MKDGAVKIDISATPMDDDTFDAFYKDLGALSEKYDIAAPIVLLFHIGQLARCSVEYEVDTCGVPPADSLSRHIEAFAAGLGVKSVIDVRREGDH